MPTKGNSFLIDTFIPNNIIWAARPAEIASQTLLFAGKRGPGMSRNNDYIL